jgi:glycosyltransferase involved in cell wall biosynthesis
VKIAIVHDWIVTLGGAERVLKEIYSLFPEADLFTLFYKKSSLIELGINPQKVKVSFMQKIPFVEKKYRCFLPIMPYAVESLNLSDYDIVISSSHAFAKGVLTGSNQIHISYIHTPMRYAWEMYYKYLKDFRLDRGIRRFFAGYIFNKIRIWDLATSNRPDYYIANSQCVAKRIKKFYGKDSLVIYPPVELECFKLRKEKENFYITAGRLVPYKRTDLIVTAFSKMPDKYLVIIGDGPELKRIKYMVGKNVEILGHMPKDTLADYLSRAKAFVFAAEEDFGILPVEAQACGTPVIAYGRGGARETVIEGKTGLFFMEQHADAIVDAVYRFEKMDFNPVEIRKNAERFSCERFRSQIREFIASVSTITF